MQFAQLAVFLVFQYLISFDRSELFDSVICDGAYTNSFIIGEFEKQIFLYGYSVFVTFLSYLAATNTPFPPLPILLCMHIAHYGLILISLLYKSELCPAPILVDPTYLMWILAASVLYSLCLFNPTKQSLKAALAYTYLVLLYCSTLGSWGSYWRS